MIFPISKSCYKLITSVYDSNGIKISKLLREATVSQKIGYQHVDELKSLGIIKEETIGSLRIIKPALENETGSLVYGLIEKERELELINKKPFLKNPLQMIKEKANDYNIESVVLFGSFIKDGNEKIDILVISEVDDKRIVPFLQECFNSVENAVSARILSKEGFTRFKETKKDLFEALFNSHVCIHGTQSFLKIIA